MKFLKNEVRAVRGAKLYSFEYWVHIEVLIDGKWITPYLVDEEKDAVIVPDGITEIAPKGF